MSITKSQIRERLLHEFQLGHSAAEARRNICEALGYEAVKQTCAKKWFKRFRNDDTSIEDKSRSGRPIEVNRDVVLEAIDNDPTLTTRMLSVDLGCSHMTISKILHSARFRVRHGKWMPHDLTISQKSRRYSAAKELLEKHEHQPFLHRIVTCDEKWVLLDNRCRSNQWLRPNQKPKRTPKPNLHQTKVMLCIWWFVGGVVHWELVEQNSCINSDIYSKQLEHVQAKLRKNPLRQLFRSGVILQQDNARPHVARRTLEKIKELGWECLIHPPYSPDAAPSDYHLFRSLQHNLVGKRFTNVDEVKMHLSAYFDSKPADFYRQGIEKLPQIWRQIIDSNGDYFD